MVAHWGACPGFARRDSSLVWYQVFAALFLFYALLHLQRCFPINMVYLWLFVFMRTCARAQEYLIGDTF